ncbi:DMT family transporter [bacterium 210820-DFI.6.37]|nr:DMT family transporter [bacterium 210820-DFI.6.37]
MNRNITGNAMLLLTAAIWGTSFIATKSGAEGMGPFAFNAVRSLIGGIALFPVIFLMNRCPKEKREKEHKKDLFTGGSLCGIALFLAGAFQQVGILYTSAGKAGFITALYVVIVPLFRLFSGKREKLPVWLCVGTSLAGFCLLCMPQIGKIGIGDLLVLAGAVGFAIHILIIDYYVDKADTIKLSCIQFFSCSLAAFFGMFIIDPRLGFDELHMAQIIDCLGPLFYSGIMSCSVAYTLQVVAQKRTNSVIASMILSLESVFAVISGMIFFGETMAFREILGCIVIFCSIVAAQISTTETPLDKKL